MFRGFFPILCEELKACIKNVLTIGWVNFVINILHRQLYNAPVFRVPEKSLTFAAGLFCFVFASSLLMVKGSSSQGKGSDLLEDPGRAYI